MASRDQWAYSSSQELRHAARVQGRSVGRVGSDVPRSRNLRGHAADARDAVRRTAIPDQGIVEWHRSRRARGRDKPTPLKRLRQIRGLLAWHQLRPGTNSTRRPNPPGELISRISYNSPLNAKAPQAPRLLAQAAAFR